MEGKPLGKSLGKSLRRIVGLALISTSTAEGAAEPSRAVGAAEASRVVGEAEASRPEGTVLGANDGDADSTICKTQTSEVASGRHDVLLRSPASWVVH